MILSILRDYWTQMLLFAQNQYQNVCFYGNKNYTVRSVQYASYLISQKKPHLLDVAHQNMMLY